MAGEDDAIVICGGPNGAFGVHYANARFADISGKAPGELIGQKLLAALSEIPQEQRTGLTASLALPQPIFQHLDVSTSNGVPQRFELAAWPAPPGTATPVIWVIRLREQGLSAGPPPIDLDFADHLPIGLALFDADDRLTWFNGTYHRVLGPNAHLLKVGELFEDIMSTAYRSGHAAGGTDDIELRIAERLARHRNLDSFEEALSGGRWLLTQEIGTTDGGTLGVRTDITEIKSAGDTVG